MSNSTGTFTLPIPLTEEEKAVMNDRVVKILVEVDREEEKLETAKALFKLSTQGITDERMTEL